MTLIIIQQPPDGSCFFHSMFAASDPIFFNLTKEERLPYITKIRKFFANNLVEDVLPQYMLNHMIIEFQSEFLNENFELFFNTKTNKEIKEITQQYFNVTLNGNKKKLLEKLLLKYITADVLATIMNKKIDWTTYALQKERIRIKHVCNFADNISILMTLCYLKRNIIMLDHDTKQVTYTKILNKHYPTVVLDYELNYHYELFGIIENGTTKVEFEYNHPFIQSLL